MNLLQSVNELILDDRMLDEGKSSNGSTGRSDAAKVYHRDYVRTRDKPYRKYKKKSKSDTEGQ